ncbi:MAG: FAD-dependent oxidoreductase [Nitrospinae bacterium]|nr:FAD-dependent oxidoreductase [Nitrospinota bacterium]
MKRYLIIGNGIAGMTAVENIRKLDKECAITILTEEPYPFYYRLRLNEYLAGDISADGIIGKNDEWYKSNNIEIHLNSKVIKGNVKEKVVTTEKGEDYNYDKLLLATGSHAFIPPIDGSEKDGVFTLRSLEDAKKIFSYGEKAEKVVVIGGGLLGLEAGNALRKRGKKVTVVEFFPRLLPRQLDKAGGEQLRKIMEGLGFSLRLAAKTESITGDKSAEGVRLGGGETLPAGMVIISAGVRANLELAQLLSIECDRGIKVDANMKTNINDIYAAGDSTEFSGRSYGIWPAAVAQGKIAGENIAGIESLYEGTTMSNILKVADVDLASVGEIDADDKLKSIVLSKDNIYKKVVTENDVIIGAIMLGDTKGYRKISKAINDGNTVVTSRNLLISEGFKI